VPIHLAALYEHIAVLEVLCKHAPATLEAKNNLSGVCGGGESLTAVRVRPGGYTPLHFASKWYQSSVKEWITERLPYQVMERNNHGVCVCVCCGSLS
jgi:hypothetical protein